MRAKKSIVSNITLLTLKVLQERFVKLVILPTTIVVIAVVVSMSWPLATPIGIRLMTERVEFILAGNSDPKPILNQARVESIGFMKFGKLLLTPQRIEVANPSLYNLASDTYPDSAWKPLDIKGKEVTIVGAEDIRNPTVTIEAASHEAGNVVDLDGISVNSGSRISLELVEGTSTETDKLSSDKSQNTRTIDVALRIDQPQISHTVSIRGPFQLTADHCQILDLSSNPYSQSASNTYRVSLSSNSPFVQVTGKQGIAVLFMSLPSQQAEQLFYDGVIPATNIKFIREDPQAQNVSTALVKNWENKISFPGFKREPVVFTAPDFIELDERDQMSIRQITLSPKHKGFEIDLTGTANHLRVGTLGNSRDLRMSVFDKVWENKLLAILLTIISWSSGMILAVRKAYREVEGKEP